MSNSIGSYARELIIAHPDKSNQEIRDMVLLRFTEAKTSIACIAWYKSNMKKTGFKSAPPPRTLEVVEEEIISVKLKLASLEEEYEYMKIEQQEEIKKNYEYYKSLLEKVEKPEEETEENEEEQQEESK